MITQSEFFIRTIQFLKFDPVHPDQTLNKKFFELAEKHIKTGGMKQFTVEEEATQHLGLDPFSLVYKVAIPSPDCKKQQIQGVYLPTEFGKFKYFANPFL